MLTVQQMGTNQMTRRSGMLGLGFASCLFLLTTGSSAYAQTYFPPDVSTTQCSLTSEEFNNNWTRLSVFSPKMPFGPVYGQTSGMVYVFPANGPDFSATKTDNCDFYKWGAQMFLWLTSTIDAVPSAPTHPEFSARLPYVFNSEFFYRLSSDHAELLPQGLDRQTDPSPQLSINLRTSKSDEDETIAQAGGSGVLLTQASAPVSPSVTYYGIHVNRLYGYFLNLYDKVISHVASPYDGAEVDPKLSRFPTTAAEACATLDYANHKGFVENGPWPDYVEHILCPYFWPGKADQPQTIPTLEEIEPAVDFLSLAIELKTSWVETSSLPKDKIHKYVRQIMEIPTYDKSDLKHWVMTGSTTQELAMVGMHVVGSVEGHPEMIWATIEHEDNAPNATYYYTNSDGQVTEVTGPAHDTKWTFSDGTVTAKVTELAVACSASPMPDGCTHKTDIVSATKAAIGSSNVTRLNPWGNKQGKSNTNAISQNTQIISLNNDFRGLVRGNNQGDPRQFYFLSGAIWTSDGSIPTKEHYDKNTGSTILANTTMETFEQSTSCFGCHNTFGSSNGLDISHIFDGISPDLPKVPKN